jgi:hypothetical protein
MLGPYSHKTNKRIIAAMLVAFCLGLSLLFTGCTATKLNRSTSKKVVASDKNTEENQNKKSTLFDRSQITEEDYSLKLIPIDPSKDMGHTTNPDTGEQNYRNAIPVYEKKTKNTNKDVTTATEEAKTNTTSEKSKATTDETEKHKVKISLPWYAFAFLGFFAFATIIGLFFIYKLFKTISPLVGTVSELENRLKKLEP